MARLPRLTLPGYPHHIIQRGNNRQAIFLAAADQSYLLELLQTSAREFDVAVHAYVLMGDHLQLLATPQTDKGLPLMMQSVGRSYVRYFNGLNQRSGTLWEGRYRSTLVQPEKYLLPCMIYIDLSPVRAGIAAEASAYRWSSHHHYAGLSTDKLITPHPLWWALGNTPFAREAAYAELVRHGLGANQGQTIEASTLGGWALGEPGFFTALQKQTPRRVQKLKAGRPRSVLP
jgi:putative transposase